MKAWSLRLLTQILFVIRLVILGVIFATLALLILLFATGHSSLATHSLFAKIAPQYHLHYQRIEGNLYNGITLKEVTFEGVPLAKQISLHYNPTALLYKELQITRLKMERVNVDRLKQFVASFQKVDSSEVEEKEDSEHTAYALRVKAHDILLSTEPFAMQGIAIKRAVIRAKKLGVDLADYRVAIDGLQGELSSSLGTIDLRAKTQGRVLHITHLSLLDIDVAGIQGLLTQEQNATTPPTPTEETNSTTPLPFAKVVVEDAKLTLKPETFGGVAVQEAQLGLNEVVIPLQQTPHLASGKVALQVTTDIAQGAYHATIDDNSLHGKMVLIPKARLYKRYQLPLRPGAIKQIDGDVTLTQHQVTAQLSTQAQALLLAKKGAFNLDIKELKSHLRYHFDEHNLSVTSWAEVDTPYAKAIALTNTLHYDGNLTYQGTIADKRLKILDPKLRKLLEGLHLSYRGSAESLQATMKSRTLGARFETQAFDQSHLWVENRRAIRLSSLLSLPKELNATVIRKLQLDAPMRLKSLQITPHLQLQSNLLSLTLDGTYGKVQKLHGEITLPPDTLLKQSQPRIAWERIGKIKVDGRMAGEQARVTLTNHILQGNATYHTKTTQLTTNMTMEGVTIALKGRAKEKLILHTTISALERVTPWVAKLYRSEAPLPPLKGGVTIDATLSQMERLDLTLKAPKIRYTPKEQKPQVLRDLQLQIAYQANRVTISRYSLHYNKAKFFATKPSTVILDSDLIRLSKLWVNDSLAIEGEYRPKRQEGRLSLKADRFAIKEEMIDIVTAIDVEAKLKGVESSVNGRIVLLGGSVRPTIGGKSFAEDSDIVILQEMRQKQQQSPLMKHLQLTLKIEGKKPIYFKQRGVRVALLPDLTLFKERNEKLLYLGAVVLQRGGYYRFEDKKFVLKTSHVYFAGDLEKPLLDIKATYQSVKYLITIAVLGTPTAPQLRFSSDPSLTREQILSVLLFDSEEGGDTHSGDEMMRMMGGAMAKLALSSIGVKLDHLVFGENGTIEVGKKLTNKITVIYINGEDPKIELKVKHSRHTESVIGASQKSESYDIIYKGDF